MARHKVRIFSYFPQSVIIPDGIQRDVQCRLAYKNAKFTEKEERRHDFKTLFYDMFLSANKNYLTCIGPPLLNLGKPLSISCSGKQLKFLVRKRQPSNGRCLLMDTIDIKIPFSIQNNRLTLRFTFQHFNLTVSYFIRSATPMQKTKIILASMQKDYPILWIQDWCKWYRRVHGIKRIIIYDNGSKNFAALKNSLSQLNEDIEIVLVHWPFPYGGIVNHFNKYSQPGSVNHCQLMFCPKKTRWLTFLDLDEYLYVKGGRSLINYLKFKIFPIIYLFTYIVPRGEIMDVKGYLSQKRLPRFFDYTERATSLSRSGHKYICRPKALQYGSVHSGYPNLFWRQILHSRLIRKFNSYFRIELPETVFFYHYKGLSTFWKSEGRASIRALKKRPVSVPDGVIDTRVRELARDKGLLEEVI